MIHRSTRVPIGSRSAIHFTVSTVSCHSRTASATCIGSSNPDIRSLCLNYELMLRLQDKTVAHGAKKIFYGRLEH
ncbi:MAG: hypothetical protein ABSF34_07740 [Verrucomicrobiota bacterium]